jgi:hypothetical protein
MSAAIQIVDKDILLFSLRSVGAGALRKLFGTQYIEVRARGQIAE